ncbi:phage terminase large subunit-like protein [Novosphingobium chloroacetimidivorans]|uniref:Phage terminase large subunit-like protein n=1 Tax=Novosphingobium chloroacetimidivorans TaxID=1428314 RepID=A0A7W7NTY7_9SPHN|nr:phage terminase large subunit [Novosphingobium chloroacetimidivorans]MBB4857003.1 phage terminase large subunit-like protein [Novosphingobium chloroacetimidivorans]
MTQTFKLTPKQLEAQAICAGPAKHVMLFGGSRSGKTFLHVRNVIMRALKAANSRHAIFRFRFNAIKASIVLDTFPKVMRLAFPGVPYKLDKTDWYATLPNGAEIWFAGLDDAERAEKVLGMEFATIYFNECSQIPYVSLQTALTRLAQQVEQEISGARKPLRPRVFYDENPPSKAHWSFRQFIQKIDPETKQELVNPGDYASFKINPNDNRENVADDYLQTLSTMSARMRRRFLDGEFGEAVAGALFTDEMIETWRVTDGRVPDMVRIVVGVDPSGAGDEENADNDAIGIVAAGLGVDGNCYVLEDATVKAGPMTWGRVATSLFDRHQADAVVGETNYGGAMVNHVIQTARPRTSFRQVTATRGKVVRAEPFSALYEQGKVRHVGRFNELEDELTAFTTYGYVGGDSPNRADALIWCLAELFPSVVKPRKEPPKPVAVPTMASAFARR